MARFDVAVVGGGINGCGIARDAAGRGLSVALIEQDDLASGTSSASTKMIHGGLRYLEHYAFRLVRESLLEREALMRIAPHITRPLRIILPHVAAMRPAWLIRCGLCLYDNLAFGARRTLPKSEKLSLRNTAAGAPLRGTGATSSIAFAYSDCWVEDARLVILNAIDAAQHGATILPRTRCAAATADGNSWRLTLQSRGGDESEIRARCLVNAAGPWAGIFLKTIAQPAPMNLRLVQGSHIIARKLYDGEQAYLLQNRDGRVIFVVPYQQRWTLVGTTDRDFVGDPARATVSDAEVDYLRQALRFFFGDAAATGDVAHRFCGVRPLAASSAGGAAHRASRDYAIRWQSQPAPLLNIFGGKLTTYRKLAESAVDILCGGGGKTGSGIFARAPRWSATAPLPGGDIAADGVAPIAATIARQHRRLSAATAQRLARAYGSIAPTLVAKDGDEKQWRRFGADLYAWEVDYLMRREWAARADDVLWRRGEFGLAMTADEAAALDDYMRQNLSSATAA